MFAVASSVTAGSMQAQSTSPAALTTAIDSIAQAALRDGPVAGMSIAVVRNGKILVSKGYGFADIENQVPATPQTVYRIGSITKQFTAAGIMQLVESGKLSLDDEITKYLPDYPEQGHHVLIRHLLNHTSGIRSYTSLGPEWTSKIRLDLPHDSLVALFATKPFDFAPGDEWRYDNSGYYLLGMILERVSGERYGTYLQEHIFDPLGLKSTYYCDVSPILPHRAQGYETQRGVLRNADYLSMSQPFAAGSLCSTTGDLATWTAALSGGRVVSATSYARMSTPDTLNSGKRLDYGYGLGTGALGSHKLVSHSGGINGFLSVLNHFPQDSLIVVVLTNTEAGSPDEVARKIERRLLNIPTAVVKDLAVNAADLSAYLGAYAKDANRFQIVARAGKVALVSPDGDSTSLAFQGNDQFIDPKNPEFAVRFSRIGGRAAAMTISEEGHVLLEAKRAD